MFLFKFPGCPPLPNVLGIAFFYFFINILCVCVCVTRLRKEKKKMEEEDCERHPLAFLE
jgi:hypothetical protein